MTEPVTLFESYGTSQPLCSLSVNGRSTRYQSKKQRFDSVIDFTKQVFLPQGYPESVSQDYFSYQLWDTIQAFCSSITGTLAAQAVLKGFGVGDKSASILAATLTWLLKDGSSMVGRIVFAWAKGSALDSECKTWRLVADILNDASIFVQLISPHFPAIFTPLICLSGMLNAIVGVAGGATRAALTMHQARRNNMADVSAKDNSQETLVNLAGLIVNMILVPLVTGRYTLIFLLFIFFTCCHLYANWRAVKAVCMETFNKSRFHLAVHWYLDSTDGDVMPVEKANVLEPLFFRDPHMNIHIGVSLSTIDSLFSPSEISSVCKAYRHKRYIFFALYRSAQSFSAYVLLSPSATEEDQLRSVFQAELISWCLNKPYRYSDAWHQINPLSECLSRPNASVESSLQSLRLCDSMFSKWAKTTLASGKWVLCPVLFGADEYRIEAVHGEGVVDNTVTPM